MKKPIQRNRNLPTLLTNQTTENNVLIHKWRQYVRLVIKQVKAKSKLTKCNLPQPSKITKWQTSSRLFNWPTNYSSEKRKRKRGENGLCADPLAKSRFYRRALLSYFLFPFAPVSFPFSGRLLLHGSSRKSTAAKSLLKIRIKRSFVLTWGFSHPMGISAVTDPFKGL